MLMTNRQIKYAIHHGDLSVEPYSDRMLQPASLDVRLDYKMLSIASEYVDTAYPENIFWTQKVLRDDVAVLEPGEFVLASTVEYIKLCPRVAARIEGKSSLGRLGLGVHVTAGFIDPGFCGNITLELRNHTFSRIFLRPGMRIAQLCFMRMTEEASPPYGDPSLGSKYQGQYGVTPPK